MPRVNINGVNLNYEFAGQGKCVILLHGYTGSSQDWANQILVLSPKYKVLALDQRGHGKSAAPFKEEEYSLPIFTNDVRSLLKILNIKRCCLVGHSLGGAIALRFTIANPDMVAALVLVDCTSGKLETPPNFAELRKKLDELARSQGMEAAFEYDATHNPQRIERFLKHPEQKEMTRKKMLMTSVDGYIYVWRAGMRGESLTSRLSEIKIPTLIYCGEEDVAFLKATEVLKQGIADSELVKVKGAGHSPHEEVPEVFNKKLLEFLGKINW